MSAQGNLLVDGHHNAELELAESMLKELSEDTSWLRELSPGELVMVCRRAEEAELIANKIKVDAGFGLVRLAAV